MTAAEIADLLRGRRIGPASWIARCPAHPDRHPSLSVQQGDRGVLLRCWSQGCTVEQIVAALSLRMADLFNGPKLTTSQLAEIARERAEDDAEDRARRRKRRNALTRMAEMRSIADAIAVRMAHTPDHDVEGDALATLYHLTISQLRAAEGELEDRP